MDLDRIETVLESQEVPAPVRQRIRTLLHSMSDADTWWGEDELPPKATEELASPERLVSPIPIGRGGMAEVFRVTDRTLDRDVALKVVRAELQDHPKAIARFINEARVTARLQHPGIIPVHDLGRMPDGRHYFTMKLVEGSTLFEVLADHPPLRRLLDVFRSVCAAMAYAHGQGVVHRDLKPDNVMIGAFGEVLVLDWGVARIPGAESTGGGSGELASGLTRDGEITGTPAYMAPEQARGELDKVGPATDVYALGLILFEILTGRQARVGTVESVLFDSAVGMLPELPDDLDAALAEICTRCLQRDPADRYPRADVLMTEIEDWLHGARLRERAEAEVARADALREGVDALRKQVALLERRVRTLTESDADLEEIWAVEDLQRAHALQLTRAEVEWQQTLYAALSHDPDLPAAHARLADDFRRSAERAATEGRPLDEARFEVEVRRHDRGQHAAWLRGRGRLILASDPPAPGRLYQLVERKRTLVPVLDRELSSTPIDLQLERGPWLVELDGPRGPVKIPVLLERAGVWDNRNPEGEVEPVSLDVALERDRECYVPGGWFRAGGDPMVAHPQPARRVWIDGFVLRKFPVTHGEFLAFLNALVDTGREDEAAALAPRDGGSTVGGGAPVYPRSSGHFQLPAAKGEEQWSPDLPCFLVKLGAARAYAAWEAERTGLPWRLPCTLERQKAGRGVDGRRFVWGDTSDPRRANIRDAGAVIEPMPVDSKPDDISVYGVRGLTGNISDWMDDHTRGTGPVVAPSGRSAPVRFDPSVHRHATFAGGSWNSGARYAHQANYGWYGAEVGVSALGFRLARSV